MHKKQPAPVPSVGRRPKSLSSAELSLSITPQPSCLADEQVVVWTVAVLHGAGVNLLVKQERASAPNPNQDQTSDQDAVKMVKWFWFWDDIIDAA